MSAADARFSLLTAGAAPGQPMDAAELDGLFAPFLRHEAVLLAVSGGPDSTALAHLAHRWCRARQAQGLAAPRLLAATVDHGLRPEAAREAQDVAAFCAGLAMPHRRLSWQGEKPTSGIQEAARAARYALLIAAARDEGASALALAHTLDDQAETVLFRLARGSGLSGLAAMRVESRREGLTLVRPFLGVPKARLVESLRAAGIAFAEDPSNRDPRYARPRLRALLPLLAQEGLDAARLALLARRMARADAALEAAVDTAQAALSRAPFSQDEPVRLDLSGFCRLPEEVALRLLGRAVDLKGHEGPAELGKLEALLDHLLDAARLDAARLDAARLEAARLDAAKPDAAKAEPAAFRRTLAGALVAIRKGELAVTGAPQRGKTPSSR